MALANTKLVDHLAWRIAEEVETKLIPARDKLLAVKAAFVAQDPDVTGTVLEGRVAMVNAWLAALEAVCDDPIVAYCLANKSKRHNAPSALGKGL